ncbi:MAG: tRNA (guanosine(37)-N1)-methyltransferase TrmD [Planctomycetaceae bacterium]|nr:tRNA (guanosine(37)-N1)-methyltransferase TrmD [Planctomycetaceae bacterium]
MLRFDILTLFPAIFEGFFSESILKNAVNAGKIAVNVHNIRDWATDKHSSVDDRPFGGGPGMLLKVDRVVPCVEDIQKQDETAGRLLLFSPQGKMFHQQLAEEFALEKRIILLCGRYEGFDQRIIDILQPEEISLGNYVLNGGEVAAMAVIETVMRLIPGVLGDDNSARYDSFSANGIVEGKRLLDCEHYTRPREYRGLEVPEVLLNGNHAEIAEWRKKNSIEKTKQRKPELME